MRAFVLGSGPSMTQADADLVRGAGIVIAVSDAYLLAPWADFLVASDRMWWYARPDACKFQGGRLCAVDAHDFGVSRLPNVPSDISSGLLALKLAVLLSAKQVVLLGIDLQGTHFFGPHEKPLTNTTEAQFEKMRQKFRDYQPKGVEIINASPESSLDAYPKRMLRELLGEVRASRQAA